MSKEIKSVIHSAFNMMKLEYEKIFTYLYPANGSSGFTEANQTVNFVHCLKTKLDDDETVAWFEFPWENASERIDALVYSPKHKALLCIEAKRIWNEKKQTSIKNDIQRLEDGLNQQSLEPCFINNNIAPFENDTPFNSKVINIYLIALGDVWLETKKGKTSFNKKTVPLWWLGNSYQDRVPKECAEEEKLGALFDDEKSWICDLHELKTQKSPTTYCLMIAYKQHL